MQTETIRDVIRLCCADTRFTIGWACLCCAHVRTVPTHMRARTASGTALEEQRDVGPDIRVLPVVSAVLAETAVVQVTGVGLHEGSVAKLCVWILQKPYFRLCCLYGRQNSFHDCITKSHKWYRS